MTNGKYDVLDLSVNFTNEEQTTGPFNGTVEQTYVPVESMELDKLSSYIENKFGEKDASTVDLAIRLFDEMSINCGDTEDSPWIFDSLPVTKEAINSNRQCSELTWFIPKSDSKLLFLGRRILNPGRALPYWSSYKKSTKEIRVFFDKEILCWKYNDKPSMPATEILRYEFNETTSWHKKFLTFDEESNSVTAWDESQSVSLGCFTSLSGAIKALELRAEELNRNA